MIPPSGGSKKEKLVANGELNVTKRIKRFPTLFLFLFLCF
jgi:hypothetical protein